LSGSAALITLLVRRRPEAAATDERLRRADGYFALLEVALIALFLVSLMLAGTLGQALELPCTLLWLLVLASLVPPLAGLVGVPPAVGGASVHDGQLAARRPPSPRPRCPSCPSGSAAPAGGRDLQRPDLA
jgi:hypothetical protein